MNLMRKHGNLKFMLAHMNAVLAEILETFNLSSKTITQGDFKKTHPLPILPRDKETNRQACLADNQISKARKSDDI